MSVGWYAGADGCRGGWLVVLVRIEDGGIREGHARLFQAFDGVLGLPQRIHRLAVDMPVGLPDRAQPGGRLCDRAARALLGGRRSSVFSPPARSVLAADDYAQALALNRASGPGAPGLSRQAYNLLPKMRELDALLSPARQRRILEAHPELAFLALSGQPMRCNKSRPEGQAERQGLLDGIFDGHLPCLPHRGSRDGILRAGRDDLLDACALALTAWRIGQGRGRRLPAGEPPLDSRGLRMEIWY